MASASMELTLYTGATPTKVNIDQTQTSPVALLFNQADDNTTTTNPITVPTATGTHFSFPKVVGLQIITAGTTNITSIGYQLAQSLTAGFFLYFKDTASTTYADQTAGIASTATAGATPPAGYTLMSTTVQNTQSSVSLSTGGAVGSLVGNYTLIAFGVDNTYAGAGGTGVNLVSSGNAFNVVYNEQ